MEILTGTASNVRHATETRGSMSSSHGRMSGSVSTSHVCTLRVANQPVQIKLPGATNLNDGDLVTIAGDRRADGFRGYALRNESTGTVHAYGTTLAYVFAGLCLLLGIPLSFLIIGLPFLGVGIYVLWLARRQARALRMLHATPAPAASIASAAG